MGYLTDSAAAFFDLDRTLIGGSSVFVFGIAAWRSGLMPTGELVNDARNAIGFRLAGASDEKTVAVRDRILGAIAGTTVSACFACQGHHVAQNRARRRLRTGSAAVNIGLGIVLTGPLGHGGLALANSLAVSAEVLVLLLILRRRLGGVEGKQTLQELIRVLVATVVMGGIISGVLILGRRTEANVIWTAAAGGAVGVAVYVAVSRLLGVRELYSMLAALVRR